jgi:hypothetical protein
MPVTIPDDILAKRDLALQKLDAKRAAAAAKSDTASKLVGATHDDQQAGADLDVAKQQADATAADYIASEQAFFAAG